MSELSSLDLSLYYPSNFLSITGVEAGEKNIIIRMRSKATSCECQKCHTVSTQYHGTYARTVKDLPILGKQVTLLLISREYVCANEACDVTTMAESYPGFLTHYSRRTERLEDFICTLALETSCEGASRICRQIGIPISGDTIIRMLIRCYEKQPPPEYGDVIGVDDFAFKKRHRYGTILVDEKSHKTIAILEGRDEKTLREWLKENQQIKVITRDRASAYAKAIAEELPNAMQVADRFHLHQNLLEAIRKALNREIPATIAISNENEATSYPKEEPVNDSKKNATRGR